MLVCSLKKFPCIRFEPRTSGIERNCSANWATTTALCSLIVLPWLCFVGTPTHTCSFNLATTSVTSKKMPNAYKSCPIMISLEKLNILTPLQTSPINVGDFAEGRSHLHHLHLKKKFCLPCRRKNDLKKRAKAQRNVNSCFLQKIGWLEFCIQSLSWMFLK